MNLKIREQIKQSNTLFTTEDLIPLSGLKNHIKLSNNKYIAFNESVVGLDLSVAAPDIDLNINVDQLSSEEQHRFAIPYIVKSFNSSNVIKPKSSINIDNTFSFPLTFESGQVIGIILGDGWWDKKDYFGSNRTIYIADLNGNNAEYVISFFKNTLNVSNLKTKFREERKENDDKRYGDSRKYFISFSGSTVLTKWLSFNFGGERSDQSAGSMNKRIPDWIFEDDIPLEFKKGIFNGLFATDGTISISKIPMGKCTERLVVGFTSTSPDLIKGIEKLAMCFGIKYKSAFNKVTIRGNTSYAFYPNLVDCRVNNIFDNISELSKRQNWLSVRVETELASSKRYDSVVFPKGVFEEIKNYLCRVNKNSININDIDLKNRLIKISNAVASFHKAVKEGIISRYLGRLAISIESDLNDFRSDLFNYAINSINQYILMSNKDRLSIYTLDDIRDLLYNLIDACFPSYVKNDIYLNALIPIRKDLLRKLSTAIYRASDTISITIIELIRDTCNLVKAYKTNFNKEGSLLKMWENEILNDEYVNWAIVVK